MVTLRERGSGDCVLSEVRFPYLLHRLLEAALEPQWSQFYFLFWIFQCIVQTWNM